jgi:hypothetical protein
VDVKQSPLEITKKMNVLEEVTRLASGTFAVGVRFTLPGEMDFPPPAQETILCPAKRVD